MANTTALFPVLSADFSINFIDKLSLLAKLQFFLTDVNRYSGTLLDFGISGHYQLFDKLLVGVGYKFYRQDIDSGDEDFFGDYRFEYQGPVIDVRARF